MVRRSCLVVLVGLLLVASCAAKKDKVEKEAAVAVPIAKAPVAAAPKPAPKPAPKAAPVPVAADPVPVATPAAVCTTCADAFQAAGWNLASLPRAVVTDLEDATSVVTCFVPPAAALTTLQAQFTQLKVPKATQAALVADIFKYHISSALTLAITPATIDANTPLATRSALACSTNKIIASPDAAGAGLILVDGGANKMAATKVPGTCKTVAAYNIDDLLQPCLSVKALAAAGAPAAAPPADPAADPTADPTATPAADPTAAPNPLANGDCLDQVLGAVGCVAFAKLLTCTTLHSNLVQGTLPYTLVCATDDAVQQSALSCSPRTLESTLDGLRYHVIPGKSKPWAMASSAKGTVYTTLKTKAECNQNQLILTNGGAGGTDQVTGGAFSGNVVAKDKVACKGKVRVIAIDRVMQACCTSRSDQIKKLTAGVTDPLVRKFITAFISHAGTPGAGGTLFLPQPAAIVKFIADAKSTNYTLTDGVIREITAFHLTTSTTRVTTDLVSAPSKPDTTQLSLNASMTVCSTTDPSYVSQLTVSNGDSAQEASSSPSVFPKGAYIVTGAVNSQANLLQQFSNCDGVIYVIDSVLRPCPSVASNETSTDTGGTDPLGGGLGGGLGGTPGLADPLGGTIGGPTTGTGGTRGGTAGLGGLGNNSGLGAFGLGSLSPAGSAAAGSSASAVVVALAAVLAAAVAMLF